MRDLRTNPTLQLEGPTATVSSGGYDHATFALAGLHPDVRLLLAGSVLLQGATAVLVAATRSSWKINAEGMTPDSVAWPHTGDFTLDFWPIGIGLALFALATVFRYGAKLEGDRAALQRETTGLV